MTLGIQFLTGYSASFDMATQQVEWPPHPARVYMALAAAHFETGADPEERRALEWLEEQPAPTIYASEADIRSKTDVFVVVNDSAAGILNRSRQVRQFPKCRPETDTVYLSWASEASKDIEVALERLCRKVTRIGHSSSLVQVWLQHHLPDASPAPWIPDDSSRDTRLRLADRGFLQYLENQFNGEAISEYFNLRESLDHAKGREKQRLKAQLLEEFPSGQPQSNRPVARAWCGYRVPKQSTEVPPATVEHGPFDSAIIVLRKVEGPALGLGSTLQLTGALRSAVMKHGHQPPPEWVSGHTRDGDPSRNPHLAFFPLPFVGAEYADGHLMGLGIAVPDQLFGGQGESRDELLRQHLGPLFFDPATGQERNLELCRKGVWLWRLQRESSISASSRSLDGTTWTRTSRHWASVTPVVLHHYPKRGANDVERILREAFESAGLPEPENVDWGPVSRHQGAGHIKDLPPYEEGGKALCRHQTHVTVMFKNPVQGPVLVGRGRFRGYGLFRPLKAEGSR